MSRATYRRDLLLAADPKVRAAEMARDPFPIWIDRTERVWRLARAMGVVWSKQSVDDPPVRVDAGAPHGR